MKDKIFELYEMYEISYTPDYSRKDYETEYDTIIEYFNTNKNQFIEIDVIKKQNKYLIQYNYQDYQINNDLYQILSSNDKHNKIYKQLGWKTKYNLTDMVKL